MKSNSLICCLCAMLLLNSASTAQPYPRFKVWYQWKPGLRENKKVKVLVSLSPENFPMGIKHIITDGDMPVVWTNTDYRMIYLNMGHGPHILSDATQNMLIINAFRWVITSDKKGNVIDK
ncbi:MAG TPA: ThuA domain-containing protein [Chitinophagaceae bacterium]